MFKCHLIESNHSPKQTKSRHLWSTSFAPDYSATVLAACTNSHEHSRYVRFLWDCHKKLCSNKLHFCHVPPSVTREKFSYKIDTRSRTGKSIGRIGRGLTSSLLTHSFSSSKTPRPLPRCSPGAKSSQSTA
jgi:hypothetical protein